MGFADRDYYRDERQGIHLGGQWSAVGALMAINAAVFLIGMFSPIVGPGGENWVQLHLALGGDLFQQPWNAWQLLTYGFVHADIWHIAFNMLGLWVFGAEVESVYGKREFYRLYLSLIVCAGLVFAAVQTGTEQISRTIGASGGVMGVAVIFACHFPRRSMLVFPIPVAIPAAVLVAFYILMDLLGVQSLQSPVAHWAHLGGAAFGFLYFRTGWSLFRLWPRKLKFRLPISNSKLFRRPKLRLHHEERGETDSSQDDYLTTRRMQQQVDQLLEKISSSGESSLTEEERQFLANASRRYQQQRRR
ncbi:MAG: rhomboid family intramembrane serine protease [Pirellulales bacterium]|nr:rhomboid family intramembrane serine protease [Pirellulales bacterium]